MGALSVALIGPNDERRQAVAKALAGPQANISLELTLYPELDDLGQILGADYDVVLIDLDSDPERALDVVEHICGRDGSITVMAYSAHADPELLVRCMRAGAREFLSHPVTRSSVAEALVRASVRRDEVRRHKKAIGKLLVFVGAKGGSGVTTAAINFSVALAKESASKVALVDLDLHLGDAALTLGVTSKFSAMDALENTNRLDSDFLDGLLAKHSSGVAVLAAPDIIPTLQPSKGAIEKVLRVLRGGFAYVVVDAGSHSTEMYGPLFEMASTVYLVTQVSVADLRNANRFVTRYFSSGETGELEVVLNRFVARNIEIDEASITKAITRPAKWKIPNDFPAVRRAQNAGIPISLQDNQIARAFKAMARTAAGQTDSRGKKKRFGLFGRNDRSRT